MARILFWLTSLAVLLIPRPSLAGAPMGKGVEFFEQKIRPVLAEHCYRCHSARAGSGDPRPAQGSGDPRPARPKGGLLLDSKAGLLAGGDGGPVIVPGKARESRLLQALRHEGELRMPPKGKLAEAVVADFETWIAMGAPDPRDGKAASQSAAIDWEKARHFWAFQAPTRHAPPPTMDPSWLRKDIDGFLLAALEQRALKPVRPAFRRALIRRATFDLTGLPPTPEEIDAFLNDPSPDAFAKVVDRLLQSPHYGERWGRYWLDVARYADDQALAFVTPSPYAYRYRDWVIQALNRDMPYDRFLRLQLAGDLLPEPVADYFERLAGLGFQGLGAKYHKGSVAAQVMADELDDRIDTLGRGLLGLTVACARCHDHKYDPIPTRDYYSLAAAYNGASWSDVALAEPQAVARYNAWQQENKQKEAKLTRWLKERGVAKDAKGAAAKLADKDRKEYDRLKADLEGHRQHAPPAPPLAHGVSGGGHAMPVLVRGNVNHPGEKAPPGFLRILQPGADQPPTPRPQFTRLELAEAIASPKNPLTARVLVNRVWHYHFDRGIVGTTSNFGQLGDRPTHPELLDTLAVRFMESGWSIRWLHREIMLSAVYQLASSQDASNVAADPDNLWHWRMSPRRLDVEAWRDALLAVSGRIDRTLGGPSLNLDDPKNFRRTVYAKVSRYQPSTMLTLFDFPDANVTSDHRAVTTVPQQQLFVLNSAFMIDCARAFAARLAASAPGERERIELAFRLAYGRPPTAAETRLGLEFLRDTANAPPTDRLTPWEQYAQILLAANEFAWIE